jgi:hypothetical protein
MAAVSIYLEQRANYENTNKHADSVLRLLTNASFRSLFLWIKEEQKNKRTLMDYSVIESVPLEFRMFLLDQMSRLGDIFDVKRLEKPKNERPAKFHQHDWLAKVRSMFGLANGHAYLKQVMVDKLGHQYGWEEENAFYGMLPDGRDKKCPVDQIRK